MSSYLSEHKWSSSLKKSDIRERARRHIETSNLIKDTLPSLVNQYMQTCQQQLVQPRLSSFVTDHLEHIYNSIGRIFLIKYFYSFFYFRWNSCLSSIDIIYTISFNTTRKNLSINCNN